MKRIIIISISITVVLILLIAVIKISTFNLFDTKDQLITTIPLEAIDYEIEIRHVQSGATAEETFLVNQVSDNEIKTLAVYEKYNCLNDYWLLGDTVLVIVLLDTINVKNLPDTMLVKLE